MVKRKRGGIIYPVRVVMIVSTILIVLLSGCASQYPENDTAKVNRTDFPAKSPEISDVDVINVTPVIDLNSLGGYTGGSPGLFIVLSGNISEVFEKLKDVVISGVPQPSVFSVDDELNFVVFRGVFSSGGHGISIERVEKLRNAFSVFATYSDPGYDMAVTMAFTQPAAIIPIGKLPKGNYDAVLKVTGIVREGKGDRITEENKEYAKVSFAVK